jgi:hypothetical protein
MQAKKAAIQTLLKLPHPDHAGRTVPHRRAVTIAPGEVRRLLAETAEALLRGEITRTQAERTVRACGRITRELNQRVALAARVARLSRGPKAK